MKHQAAVLASAFSAIIQEWLTADQLDAVNAANVVNYGTPVCATGDYCDSNVAMSEAFENEMGREVDMESDADVSLWNEAWEVAKDHNFDSELIAAVAETLV